MHAKLLDSTVLAMVSKEIMTHDQAVQLLM
jgi:hypothetical protein